MKIVAIIPARFDSVRFPGKPLKLLKGKPIIQYVYEQVSKSKLFDDVIVATDDQRIFDVVNSFGKVMITSKKHKSGSDRIAEVASKIDCEIVVNVQGDEPFISKEPLQKLLSAFTDENVQVASLMHPILEDIENPNIVKVFCDKNNDALNFSRISNPKSQIKIFQHIGVYAFRKNVLFKFVKLTMSKSERNEKLEQLRLLENGIKIRMVETDYIGVGIDTPEDLERAEKLLFKRK